MSILSPNSLGIRIQADTPRLEHGYWNAAVPSTCVVPLQQHTGSRIEPLVSRGDFVREGMVLAESDRRLALPIHAPIPGRVSAIGNVQLFDGTLSLGLSIELDGEFDRLGKRTEPIAWRDLHRTELLQRVRAAGVVCGPRSAVPAHLYLGPKRTSQRRVLALNLGEHEPYLTGGIEVAIHEAEEVISGLQIAAAMTEATTVFVAIGAQHFRRLRGIRRRAKELGYRVFRVGRSYPGVTEGNVRRMVGAEDDVFLLSPETAYAIHDAVVLDKPQIDRVIAVGGGAVERPAHIRVRLGTSIADVLAECGGLKSEPARIVVGGPVSGRTVSSVNAPITKTTAAVVALTPKEVGDAEEEPCIGCGMCARACPVALDPQLLHRFVVAGRRNDAVHAGLHDCIECGLCSYVCPSRIPLVGRFQATKSATNEAREDGE